MLHEEHQMEQKRVPHVLIFPFPAQGHINCMLKLAELLAIAGLDVTFLNTEYNHERLLRSSDAKTRFARFPGFHFKPISDGLPVSHSRSFLLLDDMFHSVKTVMQPTFQDMLLSGKLESEGRPPVSCIIADGLFSFTIDVAKELGISSILFRTPSACYFWASACVPKLIEAGEIPFGEDADMDKLIASVPGMEHFLRRRDLPSFCRAKEVNDSGLQLVLRETQNSTRASAHILNTFEDLEAPILSQIRPHFPKIYTLGPLHALLSSKCKDSAQSSSSNSIFEIDRSCMKWLDSQASKSVVYVSFGSVIFMTQKQMLEFWHGIVNSGKPFLWVIRPDAITDKNDEFCIPEVLREGTEKRGYMVEWSPQEEVLQHPAVGGFLTHSGWNSTLESLVVGVPMVCWPHFADQPINSRFVSEEWKIGLDMKDTCDRLTVEKMVRDLMEDRREELMKSVNDMAEKARRTVTEGGSSYYNMEELIKDIKSMRLDAFDRNCKRC